MTLVVDRGRRAFERGAWPEAFAALSEAADAQLLDAADLDRLAVAAYLVGRDAACIESLEVAHRLWIETGDVDRAARSAFWLGMNLLLRSELARANGWFGSARRVVGEVDCAAAGYLLVPSAIMALDAGEIDEAEAAYERVVEVAERFGDRDLLAIGLLGRGEVAITRGELRSGLATFDEAMVVVTTGSANPLVVGILYCAVISGCISVFDLRRAAEWTDALGRWCDDQPGLVPYRGQCLVHRSQVRQAHGQWSEALVEAVRAEELLSAALHPAAGAAFYQLGEVHRLRGELDKAERSYRDASRVGREPAPGLALVRLAAGQLDAAKAMVRRMLDESGDEPMRLAVLPAYAEIHLAAGDVGAARCAADELAELAATMGTEFVEASAAHVSGAVLLAERDPAGALRQLRAACRRWQDLGMPYERARAQELVGLACRAVGDRDAGEVELDAARAAYEQLGAAVDLERLAEQAANDGDDGAALAAPPQSALSARECEVLRLVATGRTNREIGAVLVISEHTVARHVQNVFAKLGVSSRAAATAWAYEHDII